MVSFWIGSTLCTALRGFRAANHSSKVMVLSSFVSKISIKRGTSLSGMLWSLKTLVISSADILPFWLISNKLNESCKENVWWEKSAARASSNYLFCLIISLTILRNIKFSTYRSFSSFSAWSIVYCLNDRLFCWWKLLAAWDCLRSLVLSKSVTRSLKSESSSSGGSCPGSVIAVSSQNSEKPSKRFASWSQRLKIAFMSSWQA